MLNEDNEAVEAVSADAEPEGSSEATVETSAPEPVEAAPEATQEATPVAVEEEIEVPPVFDWNGEYESLHTANWVKQLDENLRDSVLNGIQEKYQHWQRGYTSKYQDLAKQRRSAEELMKEVREQEVKVQRWLHGDIDPMIAKQKEVDELKVAHRTALKTLRREAEEAHEKAVQSHGTAMEQAVQERDTAMQQYKQLRERFDAQEAEQTEAQVTALETWLTTEYKDVYDNDDAFKKFCQLARADISPEEAAKMVRVLYPLPTPEPVPEVKAAPAPAPAPEPEPVPEGMKLMNMGPDTAAATEGGDPRSYQEMMEAMRKNAMVEQELLLRG